MRTDFLSFCRDNGILIDHLPPMGKIRSYPTEDKPRSTNGRVMYDGDFGWCQNWRFQDKPVLWFEGKDAERLSDAEKERLRQRQEADRRKHAQEQAKAISDVQRYFSGLPALHGNHPYLENKGLDIRGCSGLRIDGENLIIPMIRGGQVVSVQTIAPDGSKKFRYGCPTKGTSYLIGNPRAPITAFCEGFATGLTIFQAIPTCRVVVCFNASGLAEVVKAMSKTFRGMAVICADNDYETASKDVLGRNPGLEKGREAAKTLGCGIAYPEDIKGSDWDDARQEWGESERDPDRARNRAMARIKSMIMRQVKAVKPTA